VKPEQPTNWCRALAGGMNLAHRARSWWRGKQSPSSSPHALPTRIAYDIVIALAALHEGCKPPERQEPGMHQEIWVPEDGPEQMPQNRSRRRAVL